MMICLRCFYSIRLFLFSYFLAGACNPGCQNGGVCSQTPANTTACVCPPEYTGSLCETSVLGKFYL